MSQSEATTQDAAGARRESPRDAAEATPPSEPLKVTLKRRLDADGRWPQVEPLRDQMMREARASGLSKEQAQQWVYAELDRLYPPPPLPQREPEPVIEPLPGDNDPTPIGDAAGAQPQTDSPARPREGRLQGLDAIPETWPQLPGNATLAAELSWVQAERLRVVEERPSGAVVVHLDRAGSPAPSWAALSWLETSIRSYAKFVDICAEGLASQDLESDMVKRERKSIAVVRRLLA